MEFRRQEEHERKTERGSSNNPLIFEILSVFVLLGAPRKDPPWSSKEWPKYFEELNQIVEKTRGTPHVSCIQLDSGKIAKPGRLRWDEDTKKRWTLENSASKTFYSLVVTCPSAAVCLKEEVPPDFHMHMSNELIRYRNPNFNPAITIVLRQALSEKHGNLVEKTILHLAKLLDAVLVVEGERTFARPLHDGGLVNCLTDEAGLIFRAGNHHFDTPSISLLDETWANWHSFKLEEKRQEN